MTFTHSWFQQHVRFYVFESKTISDCKSYLAANQISTKNTVTVTAKKSKFAKKYTFSPLHVRFTRFQTEKKSDTKTNSLGKGLRKAPPLSTMVLINSTALERNETKMTQKFTEGCCTQKVHFWVNRKVSRKMNILLARATTYKPCWPYGSIISWFS